MRTVAVFTDTYLPTVNGVSYTVRTWCERWRRRGGGMALAYPDHPERRPGPGEHPVPSAPLPFYRDFRFSLPSVPEAIRGGDPDVVHAHTPFTLGLAGRRLAADLDVPLVVSYHTPIGEYAGYLSDTLEAPIRRIADGYERWYLDGADAVVAPSGTAAEALGAVDPPTHVVSNGVDTDRFRPAADHAVRAFERRHGLPDRPLVGYTGRHGHEKRLGDLLEATAGLDAAVVLAGDGPARPALERRAASREDVTFLGFLDRSELSAFYTALDAFAFPSPVETQGLVALEAIACGTPVVASAAGALTETVTDGETGTHFPPGDTDAFRDAIARVIGASDRLPTRLAERRDRLCVERSIDDLEAVYDAVSE
ncbi:glycosyltransferase [Natronomonas sp. LN261]|jgi:1,2-diacylglycerol 3-alpha-glucosyltransferase|uniref:glycosyltransferase n=1 Tax=Natronomonas sp. LN261 TaxID=2750669 RepID=UPI0015EE4A6E|nr:glycosyltransferase [Natronomonas sp. LN261]